MSTLEELEAKVASLLPECSSIPIQNGDISDVSDDLLLNSKLQSLKGMYHQVMYDDYI